MSKTHDEQKITIDGNEYALDGLSENARAQISNIQFVDVMMQQLNNELAVADTARIGYTTALTNELSRIEDKK